MTTPSRFTRWHFASLTCVVLGVLICCAMAVALRTQLGAWQWGIYLGTLISLAGAYWFRWELTAEELDLESREQQIAQGELQLQETRELLEKEFASQTNRLQQQEQALSHRLATYHEWLEFPQPTNLADVSAPPPASDTEIAALIKKDQQLQELLQAETEVLFERIRTNRYAVEGKFQLPVLRDDLLALMTKCARIYQPSVDQPLLETSLERLLRALSRSGLQMLVVLENMPVDLRNYNLNSLYAYVRQAVNAYGAYKAVRPYWGYANTAIYLGRLALGANPISLGAWWFVSTLGKEGAQAIATRLVYRQALAMLQDMVRVIGYEVAATYGGDFRHRDANWIYAAELTSLVARFPLSRDSLRHALREVSSLTLRSEYDRVFLTRCLATGVSAKPEQYRAALMLTATERRAIAQGLEKFLAAYIHGKTPARVQTWQREVEARLDVKLSVGDSKTSATREVQLLDAARSLIGFLTAIKQLEIDEALRVLPRTKMWREISSEARTKFSHEMSEQPQYFYAEPDLDPEGDLVDPYLDDLAQCAARFAPRGKDMLEMLRDVALYLRQPERQAQDAWSKQLELVLRERSIAASLVKSLSPAVMQATLDLLGNEQLIFLYRNVSAEGVEGAKTGLWLLGTAQRMVLFAVDETGPQALWTADSSMAMEVQKGLVTRDVLIRGGIWLIEPEKKRILRVPGPLLSGSDLYFQALLAFKASPAMENYNPVKDLAAAKEKI